MEGEHSRSGLSQCNTPSLDLKDDSAKMETELQTLSAQGRWVVNSTSEKRASVRQHMCEFSERESHLWPQDPDDDSSQLFVLAPKLSHLVQARLKLPVSGVDAPHHLQILFPFPFDNVSQQQEKEMSSPTTGPP